MAEASIEKLGVGEIRNSPGESLWTKSDHDSSEEVEKDDVRVRVGDFCYLKTKI